MRYGHDALSVQVQWRVFEKKILCTARLYLFSIHCGRCNLIRDLRGTLICLEVTHWHANGEHLVIRCISSNVLYIHAAVSTIPRRANLSLRFSFV
jgi:hypothetical protein